MAHKKTLTFTVSDVAGLCLLTIDTLQGEVPELTEYALKRL